MLMGFCTERIAVANHTAVGAAIYRQLIRLGHPRNLIFPTPSDDVDWTDTRSVRSFFEKVKPAQVYVGSEDMDGFQAPDGYTRLNGSRKHAGSAHIVQAALKSGVRRLMQVTTAVSRPIPDHGPIDEARWLSAFSFKAGVDGTCAPDYQSVSLSRQIMKEFGQSHGLDYRCILTSQPYGPSWSMTKGRLTNCAGAADRFIRNMFHSFSSAMASPGSSVMLEIDPSERFDLLYVDDVADAAVFLMELPQCEYNGILPPSCSHINTASDVDVGAGDLVQAIAIAIGFHGAVELSPVGFSRDGCHLDNRRLREFGWRPLVELTTGLELTAMAHKLWQLAEPDSSNCLRDKAA